MTFEIIAQPGAAPDAVLAYSTPRTPAKACRLLQMPSNAVFDAKLSWRWSRAVYCTEEFSRWWNGRRGRPHGFFLRCLT